MVQDEKTIAQSALVTSNNIGHDRVSHTLVFYVNGKEVYIYFICSILISMHVRKI